MEYKDYLNSADQWMIYSGFKKMDIQPGLEVDRMFYKGSKEVDKFGSVDRFCYIKKLPNETTRNYAEKFSEGLFDYSLKYKRTFRKFIRSTMFVFPLIVVENISTDLYDFTKSYCPKHSMAIEFPCILSMGTNDLYYYPSTPFWGALYYGEMRDCAGKYFSPKIWTEIAKRGY